MLFFSLLCPKTQTYSMKNQTYSMKNQTYSDLLKIRLTQ
jgi:hypothetical protein